MILGSIMISCGISLYVCGKSLTISHSDIWSRRKYSKLHDDVIKWEHLLRYWPFVQGIHWSRVNSPQKGQWHRAFFDLCLIQWLSKQSRCQWSEMPSHSLWHHCNALNHWHSEILVTIHPDNGFVACSPAKPYPRKHVLGNALAPNRWWKITWTSVDQALGCPLGPLLLTLIYFNPSMDK